MKEEDKALQEELEHYVNSLKKSDVSLYVPTLKALQTQIKNSTTSMTSVPKPLMFLRPHYETLKALYDEMPTPETKNLLAHIVSILAMTISTDSHKTNGEALKFRLIGGSFESIGSWGHQYVRHISGEISAEFQASTELAPEYKDSLMKLVEEIIPYNMRQNAVAESCDLLIESKQLNLLEKYIDNEDLCQKVYLYLRSIVLFWPDPDKTNLLRTILSILLKFNKLTEAARVAMQLQDSKCVQEIFYQAQGDKAIQKQIAFMIGRQQIVLDIDDQDLFNIASNSQLNRHFLKLARQLDIMKPMTPDDIYSSSMNVDSAHSNLATSFVNGFVNAGFGKDKFLVNGDISIDEDILTDDDPSFVKLLNELFYKDGCASNEIDMCVFSAISSLGLILLWDVDDGMALMQKYVKADRDTITAGALLACGILNSGVRKDSASALLDYVPSFPNSVVTRIGAIIGLGLAYAGSNRETLLFTLLNVLNEPMATIQIIGITAISCGLIAVGSMNNTVTPIIIQLLIQRSDLEVTSYFARFLPLALGLCLY